jgi:glycosyltransferase involved in cell wall biosynthesis
MLASLAKLGVGTGLKLVYMQHMHIGVDKKDLYHTWLYDNLDAWVVPLEILRKRLISKTNYDQSKIAVIPFGIEMERFTTALPSKPEARRNLELPEDAFIVGMVGRLEPEKCQETLVRAGALLSREDRPVQVLIVGNETMHEQSGYLAYLKRLTEELGTAEWVHFRPATTDVEGVYAALDIFALTSKSETYGMVTIEALASGLPVIGTRHGGTREIIRDGINGILIEREDPNALAAAIRTLMDSPDLASKLAQQSREDAVARYSRDRQCDLTEELFGKLLESPRVSLS